MNAPMPPMAWKVAHRLVQGDRIVVVQLMLPTAAGGMVNVQCPPMPSTSAKQFATDIEEAATGLVVATRVPT